MAVTLDQLEQLYLAYFGRPADFQGVAFYTANPDVTLSDVAATFGTSAESQALYGPGFNPGVINAIYQNLFNRDADPEGLLFWSQVVARGDLTPAGAALAILQGARNEDAIAIQNKLAAATAFTNALNTAPEILGYSGQNAAALARAQLHAVTDDATTLTNYVANVDAEVAAVVGVGGTIGQDFTLTSNVDTITITDATTINTVHGVVDGANSTFSVGDTINGNGKTIVSLAVASAGAADFTTLKNVKEVDVLAGTSGSVTFDALSWSGVGSVNLTAGKAADVFVDNLNTGAGLSMATGIGGSVSASYTDGHFAWIHADKAGSISYADGGAIVGVAGAAGSASASVDAETSGVNLNVGDIKLTNAAGTASSLYAGVFNTQAKGGDINVGNVTLSGANHVWLTVENTGHSASSDAVNTKVGSVTVNVAASGTLENFEIHQTSAGPVGDLTVGGVNITLGKNAGTSSGVTIENTGAATVGESTVGSVNVALGKAATLSMTIEAYAHSGTGSASVGGLTIGNINQTLAQSATMDFHVYHSASVTATAATSAAAATVGTTTIGAVSITAGQASDWTGTLDVQAYNAGTGAASVGNVSIASINLNAALDSTLEWTSTISADAVGGDATVGDVAVGDQTLTLGIGAYMSFTNSINANGSTSSAIGNVTLGNATIVGDDGSTLDYFMYDISSDGSIGDVTVGNMSITGGVQADLSSYYTIDAAKAVGNVTFGSTTLVGGKSADIFTEHNITAATIGNVKVGDMSITGVTNATMYASLSVSGDTIGTVSVGNLSAVAGKSGSSTIDVWAHATTEMGNVTVGTVNVSAVGANSTGEVNVYAYGNGTAADIGSLTIGAVTMNVKGTSAYGQFSATLGASADTAGTLTVGNMDLSVGNKATKTGAQLYVNVDNAAGNAVVGNITLHGTTARTTADLTQTYSADVNVTGAKVTVGNITVTGGDGASDNFNNLAFLNLTSTAATPSVTIGNVDYSGYGAKATIDVSAFKGAASIVGTAKADTITDNKGTNSITGGAGADKFVFNASNANLTAATVDTVTDFSETQGDKLGVAGFTLSLDPNSTYGENTYADFAAFVSGANGANKEVLVGQIGSDSYVAFDAANDGTVDFIVKLAGVSLSQINVADFI